MDHDLRPSTILRPSDIEPYLLTEDARFTTGGGRTVVSLTAQDEETDFVEFPAGLAGIAPVRAGLPRVPPGSAHPPGARPHRSCYGWCGLGER